jgi:hypothetical protein
MAQIQDFNISKLKSAVREINDLTHFLETGKNFFIIAEEQQEITLIEIRKKVESVMTILKEMNITLSTE